MSQVNKNKKEPSQLSLWVQKYWVQVLHSVFFVLVIPAAILLADDQIEKRAKKAVLDQTFQQELIKSFESEFNSLAFPAYFVLGDEGRSLEQFVPIYVENHKTKVDLFITVTHQGAQGQPLRQIEVFVDSERLEIPGLNKATRVTKNISLTASVDKAKNLGVHDFNDKIYSIGFRADPTQQTKDIVSISALIVVHGKDRRGE